MPFPCMHIVPGWSPGRRLFTEQDRLSAVYPSGQSTLFHVDSLTGVPCGCEELISPLSTGLVAVMVLAVSSVHSAYPSRQSLLFHVNS